MNFIKGHSPKTQAIAKGLLAAAVITGVGGVAQAQTLLQQQGTLAPMEDAYMFEGETGQVMTIELKSEEFDTMLMLRGPDGEVITSNDDYGGTLNSTIVIELPESGTYSAVASSFGGDGGSYQIEVRPASEYEQVFSRAYDLSLSEDFDDSIETYNAAIELNDTDPAAYLGRAEARIGKAYREASIVGSIGSDPLPSEAVESVVADFLKAADLLEQAGQSGPAQSLREQAQYFLGEPPATDPMPASPDVAPEDTAPDLIPIPVEPDGGIGDGATPLPEATD
ncbi:MAG: Bacterial pre-peptidase C-terminal domain/TPR repeat [Phormidesmis priestleyi Ana]|uniref:Bacterial pre-peptidase C-terminal domain/TPR repeat n=1 Tax=Phormidesmis priestleyi Ana TaxID=1666911 RepID=A0A0N8KMN2_9CYAN|nr:MAG: Bacterial pre-peptidase C-terminal domain/TPR repeat [Phormidesmis priestleyi Ana]